MSRIGDDALWDACRTFNNGRTMLLDVTVQVGDVTPELICLNDGLQIQICARVIKISHKATDGEWSSPAPAEPAGVRV